MRQNGAYSILLDPNAILTLFPSFTHSYLHKFCLQVLGQKTHITEELNSPVKGLVEGILDFFTQNLPVLLP